MPKIVHLIRHAQGLHNLPPEEENAKRHDPDLTEKGVQDCLVLRDSFPHHDSITLLCASPMRRGIQTASIVFQPLIDRGMKIIAMPDAQEGWKDPANTGTDAESLKAEFGEQTIDFGLVKDGWQKKEGRYAADPDSLRERARRLLSWLHDREEQDIVVVGHGYFSQYVTNSVNEAGEQIDRNWRNLEWRSYYLLPGDGSTPPYLKELDDTSRTKEALPN